MDADHAGVLPFEMFSFLYHYYPKNFAARFLGSSEVSLDDAGATLRSIEFIKSVWRSVEGKGGNQYD